MICRDTPTLGWVCGWLGGSVGQWLGSGQITKNLINLDPIKIIQFCLKIYDFFRNPYLWVGCMGGWVGPLVESCQITKNQINFDLVKIIQFCLQIDDPFRYLHAHTTDWSESLAIEIMSIIHSPTVWLHDNWLIMHNCQFWTFFGHFLYLTYYLNHLSHLQCYFSLKLVWF